MAQPKIVRVRVLRGFTSYAAEGEEKVEYMPGAVVDLLETDARAEFHIKRCEEVDPSTPLADGFQELTTGETAEQIAKRKQAEKDAQQGSITDLVNKAVADALAKAKK